MTRPKWPTHQKKTLLVKRDWTSRKPPWRRTFESCIKMESRAGGTAGKKHRCEAKQFENIKAPEPDDTALLSPSGDLGISLVWHNLSPPDRDFSVWVLKSSSKWTKLSMRGPQLFSGWYQMILGVFRCSQLFSDVFQLFSDCFLTMFSDC